MKFVSNETKPKFATIGNRVIMSFNEVEKIIEESVLYEYDFVEWCTGDNRNSIIEAIIKSKYPTFGSELAVINGGSTEEMVEYQELRLFAKQSASEYMGA